MTPAPASNARPAPATTRGGPRAGAGRKRSATTKHDPSHAKRPHLDARHPVHVMLRTREDVPRLRQRRYYEALRGVLLHVLSAGTLRVTHISIQRDHLHLIVEATSAAALSSGMQSFTICAARAINAVARRRGKVFRFRYKAKQIRTRDYAYNAIAYVLNNWRRHRADLADHRAWSAPIDRYSSAVSFTGWRGNPQWRLPANYVPLPVAQPSTALLQSGWQWFGLLDPWHVPGPMQ